MKPIIIITAILATLIAAGTGIYLYTQKNEPTNSQPDQVTQPNQQTVTQTPTPKAEKIITAFGDSLTAGYGLNTPEQDGYPAKLQQKLNAEGYTKYRVINSGVSGETTAGGLRRVDWVLQTNPDIVILELGANDALRGMSPAEAQKNLESIIEKLQSKNITVVLAGMMAPRNLGPSYYEVFDAIYPTLAKKYSLELIPFFLNNVALIPELNTQDGIHPNEKGYDIVINQNVWPVLKKVIDQNPVKS